MGYNIKLHIVRTWKLNHASTEIKLKIKVPKSG